MLCNAAKINRSDLEIGIYPFIVFQSIDFKHLNIEDNLSITVFDSFQIFRFLSIGQFLEDFVVLLYAEKKNC